MILRFRFMLLVFLTCYWTKSQDELSIDDIRILTRQCSEHVTDVMTQMSQAAVHAVIQEAAIVSHISRDVVRQLTSLSRSYVDHIVDVTSQFIYAVGHTVIKVATDLRRMFGDVANGLTRLSRLYVDHIVEVTSQLTNAVGRSVIKAAIDLGQMFGHTTRELTSLTRLYVVHAVDITSQLTKAVGYTVIKTATDLGDITCELTSLSRVYMDRATFTSTQIGQSAENVIHELISHVIFFANQVAIVIGQISGQVKTNISDLARLCVAKTVVTAYQLGQRVEITVYRITNHVTQIDAKFVASVFGSVVICLVSELLTFILITAAIEGALFVFSLSPLLSVIYHQRQRKPKKEKGLASGVLVPWQSPVITLLPSIRVKVILPPLTITVIVPVSILVAMIRQKEVTKGQQSSRLLALTYKAPDPVVDIPKESPMVLEKTSDYTVYKRVPSRCRRGVLNIARKGPVTVRRPKNFVR